MVLPVELPSHMQFVSGARCHAHTHTHRNSSIEREWNRKRREKKINKKRKMNFNEHFGENEDRKTTNSESIDFNFKFHVCRWVKFYGLLPMTAIGDDVWTCGRGSWFLITIMQTFLFISWNKKYTNQIETRKLLTNWSRWIKFEFTSFGGGKKSTERGENKYQKTDNDRKKTDKNFR